MEKHRCGRGIIPKNREVLSLALFGRKGRVAAQGLSFKESNTGKVGSWEASWGEYEGRSRGPGASWNMNPQESCIILPLKKGQRESG